MNEDARRETRPVLIVEDDLVVAREIARVYEDRWPVRPAFNLAAARALVGGANRFAGAILDVRLPDGLGTDLIGTLRAAQPCLRILVLTAFNDKSIVNLVHRSGAEYAEKPIGRADLIVFARRLAVAEHIASDHACRHITESAGRVGLAVREAEVLALGVDDWGHQAIADRFGTTVNTVRSQMKVIGKKFGKPFTEVTAMIRAELREETRGS